MCLIPARPDPTPANSENESDMETDDEEISRLMQEELDYDMPQGYEPDDPVPTVPNTQGLDIYKFNPGKKYRMMYVNPGKVHSEYVIEKLDEVELTVGGHLQLFKNVFAWVNRNTDDPLPYYNPMQKHMLRVKGIGFTHAAIECSEYEHDHYHFLVVDEFSDKSPTVQTAASVFMKKQNSDDGGKPRIGNQMLFEPMIGGFNYMTQPDKKYLGHNHDELYGMWHYIKHSENVPAIEKCREKQKEKKKSAEELYQRFKQTVLEIYSKCHKTDTHAFYKYVCTNYGERSKEYQVINKFQRKAKWEMDFRKIMDEVSFREKKKTIEELIEDFNLKPQSEEELYLDLGSSVQILLQMCSLNNISPRNLVHDVRVLMNKTLPKRNTLTLKGQASAGKTWLTSSLVSLTKGHYGEVTGGLEKGRFMMNGLHDKVLLVFEEYESTPETWGQEKPILGGDNDAMACQKFKGKLKIERTPVVITTNHEPMRWCQTAVDIQAFEDRNIRIYHMKTMPQLKYIDTKLHPGVWNVEMFRSKCEKRCVYCRLKPNSYVPFNNGRWGPMMEEKYTARQMFEDNENINTLGETTIKSPHKKKRQGLKEDLYDLMEDYEPIAEPILTGDISKWYDRQDKWTLQHFTNGVQFMTKEIARYMRQVIENDINTMRMDYD